MTRFEQSFLCGLLKAKKPNKIVEVGVSAGGTTAVILNCLFMLKSSAKMYSIDFAKQYYKNPKMETGFIAKNIQKVLKSNVQHEILTGNVAPAFLEKIGKNIDLLILDTVHILPGELLDFLAIFPYLSPEAVVVLHDISLNLQHTMGLARSYSTKVVFDTVVADKILMETPEGQYPNIAAFELNEDTKKYITNCIDALSFPWEYKPGKEMELYEKCIKKHYSDENYDLYKKLVKKQNENFYMTRNIQCDIRRMLINLWRETKNDSRR